jgi:D-alanyl-D-alanine carboxypeptidase
VASRSTSARAASRDDIPVARRTVSPSLTPRRSWRQIALGAGGVLAVAAVLAIVFPQPLRRLLAPPPVQGLNARVSLDGRLLGHFPYGEARADQLVEIAPGVQMHRDAAAALQDLQASAAADGVDIRVLSAFRPIALQKQIFFEVKSERNQSAIERARVSAPPGFSEHSTGYAMDLGDGRRPDSNLSASFEDTQAFAWLRANANRFHFELSFPKGNRQGVSYEPWHWRFEGTAEALRTFEAAQRLRR